MQHLVHYSGNRYDIQYVTKTFLKTLLHQCIRGWPQQNHRKSQKPLRGWLQRLKQNQWALPRPQIGSVSIMNGNMMKTPHPSCLVHKTRDKWMSTQTNIPIQHVLCKYCCHIQLMCGQDCAQRNTRTCKNSWTTRVVNWVQIAVPAPGQK